MAQSTKTEFAELARILVLIGGALLVVFGLFTVLGGSLQVRNLGFSVSGSIFGIAVGAIALYGHTRLREVVWAVILLVLGLVAGGLGGLLVLLGSLIALIMRFI